MYHRRGRGARQEPYETDPRFFGENQLGRVAPTQSNWGSKASLLGSNPGGVAKLIRLEGDGSYPWQVSVSTLYTGGAAPVSGVRVIGNFGSGSSFNQIEFDAKPDQTIQLPGAAIDLDIAWDVTYTGNAANVTQLIKPAVLAANLPTQADVSGVACSGEANRGSAIRTRTIVTTVASNWIVDLPPYADQFFVSCQTDAQYANITTLEFGTSTDPATFQAIVTYTGAQLLALKNAGMVAPVPGIASGMRITTGGASLTFVGIILSL